MRWAWVLLVVACGSPRRPPVVPPDHLERERLERAWFMEGQRPPPGACSGASADALCVAGARLAELYDHHGLPERADLIYAALGRSRPAKPIEIIEKTASPPPPVEAPRKATWRLRLGPDGLLRGRLVVLGRGWSRLELEHRLAAALPGLLVLAVRPRVPGPGVVADVVLPAHLDVLAPAVAAALGPPPVQLERIDPPPWHAAPGSASVTPGGP